MILTFLGHSRTGAVENRDDDDQSATVALAALSVSSSNLISIAESGKMGRDRQGDNLGMKKSSIGGKHLGGVGE